MDLNMCNMNQANQQVNVGPQTAGRPIYQIMYLVSDCLGTVALFSTEAKAMEFIKARWGNEALTPTERKVSMDSILVDSE